MQVRRLPDSISRVWQRDLAGLDFPPESNSSEWRAFDAACAEVARLHLPERLLEDLRDLPRQQGALAIENLPIDAPLSEPPSNNLRPLGKCAISEAVHLGIVRQFAQVFGFQEEEEGALFHQIAPKTGLETTQSNGGIVPFKPHSDDAFLRRAHRPEFLSLFGLVNERSAPTWLFPVEAVIERLPADVIERLSRPDFIHAAPTSFRCGDAEIRTTCHPVIEKHDGRWEISFNSVRTTGADAAASSALDAFREALQGALHSEVVIAPGTLLIFSNLRHLHGRGAIQGRRWLQRLYSRRDLSALRADSGVTSQALIFPAARLVYGYDASLV